MNAIRNSVSKRISSLRERAGDRAADTKENLTRAREHALVAIVNVFSHRTAAAMYGRANARQARASQDKINRGIVRQEAKATRQTQVTNLGYALDSAGAIERMMDSKGI